MKAGFFLGAYMLDLLMGDPRWVLHPVEVIGRAITFVEGWARRAFSSERRGGIFLWLVVVPGTYVITRLLLEAFFAFNVILGTVLTVFLGSQVLATRSLYDQSRDVVRALEAGDLPQARERLSMIVGRDTEELSKEEILTAVVETVAENLSDGIIAPLLYMFLGGVPLALAYKAVNTLDSMVGYKNERYRDMGRFSAHADDIANWVPARLTGMIIVGVSFIMRLNGFDAWRIMKRDGRKHLSPNSGIPEAAIAGGLGIQLGGAHTYFGEMVLKPTIGDRTRIIEMNDVKKAWKVMFLSSFMMAALCLAVLKGIEIW